MNMDSDWDFDQVLMIEDSFIQKGLKDGEEAGQPIGHTQGRMHGMEQGFILGREIGSLYGFVQTLLKIQQLKPDSIPKRVGKHLDHLLNLIESFPLKNDSSTDFDALMIPIRSKAKLVFTLMNIPYLYPSDAHPKSKLNQSPDLTY